MLQSLGGNLSFEGKMLTTDLDGTFLNPTKRNSKLNVEERAFDAESIKKTEQAIKRNGIESVMINTGRTFSELSEIEGILKETDMPLRAISLEDGKRLLTKPENMSSKEWLNLLFNPKINYMAFADKDWKKNNEAPLSAIGNYLREEKGFIHRKDDGEKIIYSKPIALSDTGVSKIKGGALWIVTLVPPGINLEVEVRDLSKEDEVDVEAFNEELSKGVEEMLKKSGCKIKGGKTKEVTTFVNSYERTDINKGTTADFVRQTLDDDTLEIRAGDAYNDVSMLKTSNPVVQSIQIGNDRILSESLEGAKNVTRVNKGELGRGIDEACKKFEAIA